MAIILIEEIRIIGLIPFEISSYVFFLSAMLLSWQKFPSTLAVLSQMFLYWMIFFALAGLIKLSGIKEGRGFTYCFYLIYLSLTAYLYDIISSAVFNYFKFGLMRQISAIVFCLATSAVWIIITKVVSKLFGTQIYGLYRYWGRHEKADRYFVWISFFIMAVAFLVFIPFATAATLSSVVSDLYTLNCLILLWIEMFFIILLYKLTYYKENLEEQEKSEQELSEYYKDLEQSVGSMRDMRHDIKNILFTLGGYIEKSSDTEMKDYYNKTIRPFTENKIKESEILSKIYTIPKDTLKSFLIPKATVFMLA